MDYLTHLDLMIKEIEQLDAKLEHDLKPDAEVIYFICKDDRMLMDLFEQELNK